MIGNGTVKVNKINEHPNQAPTKPCTRYICPAPSLCSSLALAPGTLQKADLASPSNHTLLWPLCRLLSLKYVLQRFTILQPSSRPLLIRITLKYLSERKTLDPTYLPKRAYM